MGVALVGVFRYRLGDFEGRVGSPVDRMPPSS